MKVLIDIPEKTYNALTHTEFDAKLVVNEMRKSIVNGVPIPDNATVGDVFCMLACKEPICETASYFTIDKKLWNTPYQKGGKE